MKHKDWYTFQGIAGAQSPGLSLPLCSKGALIHFHATLLRRPPSEQLPSPPLFWHICSGPGAQVICLNMQDTQLPMRVYQMVPR